MSTKNLSLLWLLGAIMCIAACESTVQKPVTHANLFSDSTIVEIYDLADRRDTEALLAYLDSDNPKYRELAAEAFGSVQDSMAIPKLGVVLNDDNAKVRKAAAYALGQTYDSSSVKLLAQALSGEDSVMVKNELLEALGKVVTQPQIELLYKRPIDDDIKQGLAWGLYRAGLRSVHDGVTTEWAVNLLDSGNSYLTRLGAAHYLARTQGLDLNKYKKTIVSAFTRDQSENVKMALAAALKNITTKDVVELLSKEIIGDNDYRVKVNALRVLYNYDYEDIKVALYNGLTDKNVNVAITAADLIYEKADSSDEVYITEAALKAANWRVKATLLGTALKITDSKSDIFRQIKEQYESSDNPYFKAALLTALSDYLKGYEYIITKTFAAEHPAISTAGMEALASLRMQPSFPDELKPAFADIFKQAMETGDIAMVAITSTLFSDTTYHFKEEYDSINFLYTAKSKLSLPKDNEALQVLNKTIAYFEGKDEVPVTVNEFNHPIDWDLIKDLPQNQEVLVKTDKGDITMRFLVNEAPGSVANFVQLAKSGYFNGKNFHRVVPNFVVQGGCNRGDGYGGENYSIRSEMANLRYQEGSVGMASAGKDTEGTQWFITHSPTPHLDGRYTIFAQVTDGMEVVHQVEVGTVIQSVEVIGSKQK
ncbi:peptidylprolyl isomerase [Fulvivirga maritima]|uniref:peptidylprolyl isomerase n=1 Tax=Fulvivirga maritima TaxID=2904247 RepID=UPI001F387658|nr:peptidylprolyl isomerase [Fulvivirga maritima]UII28165.1 peptidylprolyl isomerase [Fulvivirga maritima]